MKKIMKKVYIKPSVETLMPQYTKELLSQPIGGQSYNPVSDDNSNVIWGAKGQSLDFEEEEEEGSGTWGNLWE